MPSARSARPSAPGASRRSRSSACAFDGVAPDDIRVPAAALAEALAAPGPRRPQRAGGVHPPAARVCEAEREADVVTSLRGGHGHPADGARRPGRAVRPRRRRAAGVQRGDERRPGPGRRRRLDRPDLVAAEGPRRPAAPDDPGRVRAARRRGGVRRRRRAGDRDVRLRRRPVRAGRPGHRARLDPHGRRQAAAQGRSSASTPRPDPPRSRCWPTTAPTRRTSPPT